MPSFIALIHPSTHTHTRTFTHAQLANVPTHFTLKHSHAHTHTLVQYQILSGLSNQPVSKEEIFDIEKGFRVKQQKIIRQKVLKEIPLETK